MYNVFNHLFVSISLYSLYFYFLILVFFIIYTFPHSAHDPLSVSNLLSVLINIRFKGALECEIEFILA